jgi:hypothetical protein
VALYCLNDFFSDVNGSFPKIYGNAARKLSVSLAFSFGSSHYITKLAHAQKIAIIATVMREAAVSSEILT